MWTEPDGVDYALSFQDPEGCAEVWHFIQEVQRHMNARGMCLTLFRVQGISCQINSLEEAGLSSSPMIGPEQSITPSSVFRTGQLPHPQLGIMGEIERAIKSLARNATFKERICECIQTEVSLTRGDLCYHGLVSLTGRLAQEYVKGMIDVMHQAEDLESIENLHALCSCMQAIRKFPYPALISYIENVI